MATHRDELLAASHGLATAIVRQIPGEIVFVRLDRLEVDLAPAGPSSPASSTRR